MPHSTRVAGFLFSSIFITLFFAFSSHISRAFIEVMLFGRIPGTQIEIQFEAFTSGVVCGLWCIATFRFTFAGIDRLHALFEITEDSKTVAKLNEVSL